MRFLLTVLSLVSVVLGGCSGSAEPGEQAALTGAELVEARMVGSWDFERIEVAFMGEDNNFETVPVSVYPDQWTEVRYLNGDLMGLVQFQGNLTFEDDETMTSDIRISIDWGGDGFTDEDALLEELGQGDWFARDASIVLDHDDFYVESFVDFLSEDEVYLVWNRDDPEFNDDSCVININARRR